MYKKSFPDTEQLCDRLLLALRPFISSFLTVKVRHTFRMVRIVKSLWSFSSALQCSYVHCLYPCLVHNFDRARFVERTVPWWLGSGLSRWRSRGGSSPGPGCRTPSPPPTTCSNKEDVRTSMVSSHYRVITENWLNMLEVKWTRLERFVVMCLKSSINIGS